MCIIQWQHTNVLIESLQSSTFGSVAENYVRVSLAASDEEIVRDMCAFADSH